MGFLKKKPSVGSSLAAIGSKASSDPVPLARSSPPPADDECRDAAAPSRESGSAREPTEVVASPASSSARTRKAGHVRSKTLEAPLEVEDAKKGPEKTPRNRARTFSAGGVSIGAKSNKSTSTSSKATSTASNSMDQASRGRSKVGGGQGPAVRSSSKGRAIATDLKKKAAKGKSPKKLGSKAESPKPRVRNGTKSPAAVSSKVRPPKSTSKAGRVTPRKARSGKSKPSAKRSSIKQKLAELSDDESSYSGSDSDLSSYSESESDEETATFVSIGYNSTQDTDGREGLSSGSMSSFESTETDGSGGETLITKETALTKESAEKKEVEKKGSKESKERTREVPKKSVRSPTMALFLKKMEEFTVKHEGHQLLVEVTGHGNVEKLELQEHTAFPQPKPDEVVVKVEASTITLQDCMIRRGRWHEMRPLPYVPGADLVGTVHAVGEMAKTRTSFKVGDRVAAAVASGGNAKYATVPYRSLLRVPADTDPVVALCLSSTYVPAREALDLARKRNTPLTGANVLVVGGNGPSGLAAIELALLEGANVFATADERHHDHLTQMGATCFPIDPSKWLPKLQGKMDAVLDSVCLDGYESSSLALNPKGTLVCTGMSAVYTQGPLRAFGMRDVRDLKAAYCKMRAQYWLSNAVYYDRAERYTNAPTEVAQHFRYLCHLARRNLVKPLVSSRSPLNLVAATQKSIEHGSSEYGVCVCTPWTTPVEGKGSEEAKIPGAQEVETPLNANAPPNSPLGPVSV